MLSVNLWAAPNLETGLVFPLFSPNSWEKYIDAALHVWVLNINSFFFIRGNKKQCKEIYNSLCIMFNQVNKTGDLDPLDNTNSYFW